MTVKRKVKAAVKQTPSAAIFDPGMVLAKKLAQKGLSEVEQTLATRGKRYGDFKDHAVISQDLKDVMRGTPGWLALDANKREALEMVAHKIARILNGDPEYKDSWHDIGGYAKLAEDRCNEQ